MDIKKQVVAVLCLFGFAVGPIFSQDYESIDGALIYDHDPSTKLGDDVFGTLISDLEHDSPGRNSHGGPVCMEYPNGQIVAFNTNTSSHNLDGWSEYAVAAQQFFCNFKVGCGTESSPLGSRVQKALVRELLVVNLRVF